MLDPLAFAMAQGALRRQHQLFEAAPEGTPARPTPSLGRVRLGVARRLRAVADRIEPVGQLGAYGEPTGTDALDRDAA